MTAVVCAGPLVLVLAPAHAPTLQHGAPHLVRHVGDLAEAVPLARTVPVLVELGFARDQAARSRRKEALPCTQARAWVQAAVRAAGGTVGTVFAAAEAVRGRDNRSGWDFRVFQPQNLARKRASLWQIPT